MDQGKWVRPGGLGKKAQWLEQPAMDDPEEIYGGDGDPSPAPYEELVTALAGGLYGELERLVGAHGSGAVSGLLPQLVSVLESLQGACGQVRERDQALERLREDRLRLLEQFERERAGRKRAEEVGGDGDGAPLGARGSSLPASIGGCSPSHTFPGRKPHWL